VPAGRGALPQRYDPAAVLAALRDHPANPRRGDDAVVAGSVAANGFYGAIVAQEHTGYILAGHTRRRVLAEAGQVTGPVLWVDVDDETAKRILLADNRTAELASWDDEALVELLAAQAATAEGLAGTGFTAEALAALSAELADVPQQVADAPDPAARRKQMLASYEDNAMRQVVLVYPAGEYDGLVLRLEELREAWALPSFAAVVARLIGAAGA